MEQLAIKSQISVGLRKHHPSMPRHAAVCTDALLVGDKGRTAHAAARQEEGRAGEWVADAACSFVVRVEVHLVAHAVRPTVCPPLGVLRLPRCGETRLDELEDLM